MKQVLSKKSLVHQARELRDHLKWARSQIYIVIVGYLFLGWCWMKGMMVDDNGQRLDGFIALWTLYFIFRVLMTIFRYQEFKGILHQLDYSHGLKLKIK